MTMNWRKFLQDAFSALQKQAIPNLVIDIRNNEGGADEVIAFFVAIPRFQTHCHGTH
ncbi:MAG: hypothetical protein IPK21_23490 [Haliscomenobacter sp.]|nr:hypothetical protein [Haliscomenobacter sp.]